MKGKVTGMEYIDFIREIKNSIEEYVGDTATVTEETVLKNNAVRLHGLAIISKDRNISPTIYLEEYYAAYNHGQELSDIIVEIIRQYENSKPDTGINIDFFTDYQKVSNQLLYKLISLEKNEELLTGIPYVQYLDLAIVFYCIVLHDEIGSATILVHNKHMELWNVTTEDLYLAAKRNTKKILGYQIKGMEEIIREILVDRLHAELSTGIGTDHLDEDEIAEFAESMLNKTHEMDGEIPMYVLSNREKINGAACLLYQDVLAEFADQIDQDLFIIPSSIHEVILVPTCERHGYERLTQMVQEVNATQVQAEEILADHVYYYSRDRKEVMSM